MKDRLSPVPARFIALALLIGGVGFLLWRRGMEDHVGIDKAFFMQRLEALAGRGAAACEEVMLPTEGAEPPACLARVISSGKPFRATLAFRPWGNDEKIFAGLVRDPSGGLWLLRFDPDRTGGHGLRPMPWLETSHCRSFRLPDVLRDWNLCSAEG